MKIKFDNITIGGGLPYFLKSTKGLRMETDHVTVKSPRSDSTRSIAQWGKPRYLQIKGDLIGSDITNAYDLSIAMYNRLGKKYNFEIEVNFLDNLGSNQIYKNYSFYGEITDIEFKVINANHFEYEIEIFREDPLLYLLPVLNYSVDIQSSGFGFPFGFPFVFSGGANKLIINNIGINTVYPTIKIIGPLQGLNIINSDPGLISNTFSWSGTLLENEILLITPDKKNTIKASKNGISEVGKTNGNFDIFALKNGFNEFSFFASNTGQSTNIEFKFQPAYSGIPDLK